MSQAVYKLIWNFSEFIGIGLGRFAPYVFQQLLGGHNPKQKDRK